MICLKLRINDFAIDRLFKREGKLANMGILLSSAPMRGVANGLPCPISRSRHMSAVDRFIWLRGLESTVYRPCFRNKSIQGAGKGVFHGN